jgi:hypothetical protein
MQTSIAIKRHTVSLLLFQILFLLLLLLLHKKSDRELTLPPFGGVGGRSTGGCRAVSGRNTEAIAATPGIAPAWKKCPGLRLE